MNEKNSTAAASAAIARHITAPILSPSKKRPTLSCIAASAFISSAAHSAASGMPIISPTRTAVPFLLALPRPNALPIAPKKRPMHTNGATNQPLKYAVISPSCRSLGTVKHTVTACSISTAGSAAKLINVSSTCLYISGRSTSTAATASST